MCSVCRCKDDGAITHFRTIAVQKRKEKEESTTGYEYGKHATDFFGYARVNRMCQDHVICITTNI